MSFLAVLGIVGDYPMKGAQKIPKLANIIMTYRKIIQRLLSVFLQDGDLDYSHR